MEGKECMKIQTLDIEGSFLIERIPNRDERGYFSRLYCEREFQEMGIDASFKQMNLCENRNRWTLRGLHYQMGTHAEDKVVACTRGRIFDVFVDIRPDSKTFKKYCGYELSEENGAMLYIPKGCAHGYVTLEDDCQLLYLMSEFYEPGYSYGYRYDDPAFDIKWPEYGKLTISDKDQKLPFIN